MVFYARLAFSDKIKIYRFWRCVTYGRNSASEKLIFTEDVNDLPQITMLPRV